MSNIEETKRWVEEQLDLCNAPDANVPDGYQRAILIVRAACKWREWVGEQPNWVEAVKALFGGNKDLIDFIINGQGPHD